MVSRPKGGIWRYLGAKRTIVRVTQGNSARTDTIPPVEYFEQLGVMSFKDTDEMRENLLSDAELELVHEVNNKHREDIEVISR